MRVRWIALGLAALLPVQAQICHAGGIQIAAGTGQSARQSLIGDG